MSSAWTGSSGRPTSPTPPPCSPRLKRFLAESFKGVPEEEQRQILSENPKRVYKLD